MNIKTYFAEKLEKLLFLNISTEEGYLPVKSSTIINDVKSGYDLDKIPFSYFVEGMFFVLGADEDFKYKDKYIEIVNKTEGSIKFIKGKIAEEINHGNYEDGYILLKGLSIIEKSEDVFEKLILVLETLRKKDEIFKEEELSILEKAKMINGYFKPYYYEAIIRQEDKDYEAALVSINRYIDMSGEGDDDIRAFRDSILRSSNYESGKALIYDDPKGAIKLLLPLLEDSPEDASLYYYIGVCYRVLGNFEKSIYYLNEAFSIDKNLVQAVNELGISYASLGKYDTAISYLRKAFEATRSIEICTNLVMCYLNSGKIEEAKAHLLIAKKLDPNDELVLELEKIMTDL
jgi:tetratricopeptide (TPR) repeat protein